MELEDAVHTTILTLKEGYEGAMSETSLEIGVATTVEVEITDASVPGGKRKETRGRRTETGQQARARWCPEW